MEGNINQGIKYGSLFGGLVTIINPIIQYFGDNLEFNEMLWQLEKSTTLGLLSFALISALKYYTNIPLIENVDNLTSFLIGVNIAGLTTEENGQDWITGGFFTIGAVGGYFFHRELDYLTKQIKEGINFFIDAINRIKNFKWPNFSPLKKIIK